MNNLKKLKVIEEANQRLEKSFLKSKGLLKEYGDDPFKNVSYNLDHTVNKDVGMKISTDHPPLEIGGYTVSLWYGKQFESEPNGYIFEISKNGKRIKAKKDGTGNVDWRKYFENLKNINVEGLDDNAIINSIMKPLGNSGLLSLYSSKNDDAGDFEGVNFKR